MNVRSNTLTTHRTSPSQAKPVFVWCVRLALAALLITALQLIYPWDTTLPLARVGEAQLGMVGLNEAKAALGATYETWARAIKTEAHEYTATAGDIGLSIDTQKTVDDRLNYHWWQRLIPGSFVWRLFNSNTQPAVAIESEKLQQFTNKIQQENYKAYTNASVVVEGDQAKIAPESDGLDYPVTDVTLALGDEFFAASGNLLLKAEVLKPAITTSNARAAQNDANKILTAPPGYTLQGKLEQVDETTFGSWLVFSADEQKRRVDISLSSDKIRQLFYDKLPYAYPTGDDLAPGTSDLVVDIKGVIDGFNKILDQKGEQITVQVGQLAPTKEQLSARGYSPSQLGLQTLVSELASEKGDYAIALQELSARGWSASTGGDKKYTPASTYKLFVAYSVLKKIEAGEWSWGGSIAGTTVERCFDEMIINSDNTCAEAFGSTIGWKNIESKMRGLGLKDTVLNSGAFISTANDELLFMTKLGRGEILAQTSRDKLIDVMKRQVYRKGIPAGTGLPVADKVGFLYGLLHDAALVYSPQGTYALVILTNNSSWADIAETSARIQAQLE